MNGRGGSVNSAFCVVSWRERELYDVRRWGCGIGDIIDDKCPGVFSYSF